MWSHLEPMWSHLYVCVINLTMLGTISKYIKDVSVLRRLLFAVSFLPTELPDFWNVVMQFATAGSVNSLSKDQVKTLIENLHELNEEAFITDDYLKEELVNLMLPDKPLGVVLISTNNSCLQCKSKLILRKDRYAALVIYDNVNGSIPGSHFHKYCSNQSCSFVQYYGYYSYGSKVYYNSNWNTMKYFISSQETAFSLQFLKEVDADIFIGQVSFQQKASIYNYIHHKEVHNLTAV